jgi:hypothetical protein
MSSTFRPTVQSRERLHQFFTIKSSLAEGLVVLN